MTLSSAYSACLLLVVAAMPLYLIRFSLAGIPTNLFEISVAGLTAAGLLIPGIRRHWRRAERLLPRPVLYLVGIFVAASLLSAVISDVPRVSFGIFKSWIIIPLLLGWMVYAETRIKNHPTSPRLRGAREARIKNALIFSGVIVSLISLARFQWGERLAGIYDVPNSLALYLAPLIVLAAVRGFPSPKYLAAAGIMFPALLLTQSAAGLTAVAVVSMTSLYIFHKTKNTNAKQNTKHNAQSLPFLLSALFGFCVLGSVFLLQQPASLAVRLQLWSIGWELVQEHPLLGIGLGQFEPAYQKKLHERFTNHKSQITNHKPLSEFVFRDPHNWILSFWLNTGLLGLLSFLGIHVWIFWHSRHLLAIPPAGGTPPMAVAHYQLLTTSSALLTLLIFGLVDTIYWKNDLSALHWVLLGLLLTSSND